MGSERLTALTDGTVAIIITIMALELKPPNGADLTGLAELWRTLLSFAVSFLYVAIYWNNHHHFFKLVPRVNGLVMWANFDLLFWLSLIPFATAWMDEHSPSPTPRRSLRRHAAMQRFELARIAGDDRSDARPSLCAPPCSWAGLEGQAFPIPLSFGDRSSVRRSDRLLCRLRSHGGRVADLGSPGRSGARES